MNANRLYGLIKETLAGLPVPFTITDADVSLVATTMVHETNLFNSPPAHGTHIGMMNMDQEEFKWLLLDHIKPKQDLNDYILDYCMIDLNVYDFYDIQLAGEYNLAFQIAVTYIWYMSKSLRPVTKEEAVELYQTHWKGQVRKGTKTQIGSELARFWKESRRS